MTLQAVLVVIGLIVMVVVLATDRMRPGMMFFSLVAFFMLGGVITPNEAVAGFSNKGMITVAILFLVSEGVRQSGALSNLMKALLPTRRTTVPKALARMLPSVAAISAFLNNTAVVVIFAPMIKKWAEMMNLPSTKFLIPLSYATIVGGVCTLIGTSTNLVVHGMMLDEGLEGFTMFELGKVGIFVTLAGIIYLIAVSNWLLPGNKKATGKETFKEYYYDVVITPGSPFIGDAIVNGTLEGLPQMEIRCVKRNGTFFKVGSPYPFELEENDQLVLAGKSGSVQFLLTVEGLGMCCLQHADPQFVKTAVKQVEAVLGARFPGLNKTLGEFDFYRHYGAVVMSVCRNGERIAVDLDNLVLQEGDNLVLLTDGSFIPTWGQSTVFLLLSDVGDFNAPERRRSKRWFAIALLVLMITGATFGEHLPAIEGVRYDMFFFASITAVLMVWSKLVPSKQYTKYISWDILITIACAFAVSRAMLNSGVADMVAKGIIGISEQYGPMAILAAIYLITNIFTELLTNNAAAALTFPIAVAVSSRLGVDPQPFCVAICMAASASFTTPIGYQTNLIVQSVGGYKFTDFVRIGLPLNIIIFLLSIVLIPLFWNF